MSIITSERRFFFHSANIFINIITGGESIYGQPFKVIFINTISLLNW